MNVSNKLAHASILHVLNVSFSYVMLESTKFIRKQGFYLISIFYLKLAKIVEFMLKYVPSQNAFQTFLSDTGTQTT